VKHRVASWLHSQGLLALAYLLVASAYLPGIWTNPRHEGDEATWITASRYLEQYLTARFEPRVWEQELWRTNQAPLTIFVIGVGRRVGGYSSDELNKPWNYRVSVEQNAAAGRRPSDPLVAWARLPMALLAIAAICVAHQVVRVCAGDLAGFFWLVLCVCSAYLRLHLVRAMCEAPLVAVCVVGLALFARALALAARPDSSPRRALLLVLGCGLVSGLAASAKLNGLALAGAGLVLVGLVATTLWVRLRRRVLFLLGALALLAVGTALPLLALNPYLWPAPLARATSLFDTRLAMMARQMAGYSHLTITTLAQRLSVVPTRVLQTYAAISHADDWPSVLWINLVLLIVGLVALVRSAYGALLRRQASPGALAILLVGGAASLPPLFTPLDWNRYYMLPVFFTTMVIAIGLAWLGQRLLGATAADDTQP